MNKNNNEHAALLMATAVLLFSTLALASAPRWAACVSSALAISAVVPLLNTRRQLTGKQPLLVFIGLPLTATLIQFLPLPAEIIHLLSPGRYALAAANARTYGYPMPSMISASYDWPSTLVELAKFCGYFTFAYACTWLSHSRRNREKLIVIIALVSALVAVCALGHRALGLTSLLGLYKPEVVYPQSISPFLNPNHLAGFLAFATPLCLGVAAKRRSPVFAALAVVCAATAISADSRAGLVSLTVGITVTGILLSGLKTSTNKSASLKYLGVTTGSFALIALLLLATSAGRELLNLDLSHELSAGKFLAWRSVPEMIANAPWIGIGRGAFLSSFPEFQPAIAVTFSHLENEYLQVVVDFGIPLAILMGLSLAVLVRKIANGRRICALRAGGLGALTALAIQCTVDFGLEFPGIALPAIAVATTLLEPKLTVAKTRGWKTTRGRLMTVAVIAMLFVSWQAASGAGAPTSSEIAESPQFGEQFHGDKTAIIERAAQISRRHPATYALPAVTAKALWAKGDARAIRTLAAALERNPNSYALHFLAATLLESTQRPRQAIAEYRQALSLPGGDKYLIVEHLESTFPDPQDLILAVSQTAKDEELYGQIFLTRGHPKAATMLAGRSIQRGNKSYAIAQIGVRAAILSKKRNWAIEIAQKAHERMGTEASLLLYVDALRASNLPLLAIAELTSPKVMNDSSSLPILESLATLQLEVGRLEQAEITSQRILASADADASLRKAAHERMAQIADFRGQHHQAEWHRRQAQAQK